jgi:transposase
VSIEQLLEKLSELEAKIKFLESQLAASNARVAELEAKLAAKNKDSNNSSNPPSKDPPGTQRKYPKRNKTDRKPGAQKGHQGKSKSFEKEPDIVQTHEPTSCLECGESLESIEGKVVERRQEIDIPPIEPIITEHQLIEKICPCCKHPSRGSFPDHIRSLIQFGINTIIAVIYFNIVHHIPFRRTTKIFKDMFHMSISEGTIENILNLAETKAIKYYDQIKELLQQSKWVGSDETSIRINGQTWWRWVWQNDKLTYFVSVSSRAYQVVKDFFGESFQGILLHDCYGAQLATVASKHQLCLAHLIRELLFLIDFEKSMWAFKMIRFFSKVIKAKEIIWSEGFDLTRREKVISDCFKELDRLLDLMPIKKESHRIWKRLRKHKDKLLTFLVHEDVPATNNGSERAIRNAKIHRKISGCFRGDHAPQRHSVLLSVIETAKKQGHSLLDSCKLMLNHQLVLQA